MKAEDLVRGTLCHFRNQPVRLKYMGKNWSGNGYWHQFERVGKQGVWCELQDADLAMIELTKPTCYNCETEVNYLFDDGRCAKCTWLTVDEVTGGAG